ncbi:PAAR domain-containing protein [Paenibacillus rhizoplanae]
MGQPAAKQGGPDSGNRYAYRHASGRRGLVPTPLPHPFTGILDGALSTNVKIMGQPAATMDSTATNTPAHVPQGGPFQKPPTNKGTISAGSTTVFINGKKKAARNGDPALTCNDPADLPAGKVSAAGTVLIGG